MSQTPFISNDAISIDSPVSTLELLETSGKEIEIRDLPEPVSIFLSLNQSENDDLNNMTGVVDSEMNITVFKIKSGGDNSFYFTVKCSEMNAGQELILVLRKNSKPTTNNFDLRWNLTSCNSTLKKLISTEYLNNSEELYLGVKLAEASNLTNGTSIRNEKKIHYAVTVKAIGCYYWNERVQAWKADGCKVNVILDRTSFYRLTEQLSITFSLINGNTSMLRLLQRLSLCNLIQKIVTRSVIHKSPSELFYFRVTIIACQWT